MFEAAVARFGRPPLDRIVMLGDQLGTDVRGARDFGIDSVLLATGLTRVEPTMAGSDVLPTWILDRLD
jgi:ribonucleotide monophosphatase NagD (HAD superfamily)